MASRPIAEVLRESTDEVRSALESAEFTAALIDGSLEIESYVGYLRVLAVLHGTLETLLDTTTDPVVKSVADTYPRRTADLSRDLDFFRPRLIPDVPTAVEIALTTAAELRRRCMDDPIALVGAAHALHELIPGPNTLPPSRCGSLGVGDAQGACYLSRLAGNRSDWGLHTLSAAESDGAVHTAQLVLQGIHDVLLAVKPLDRSTLAYTAIALNVDSGSHPVPQNREILQAVLHATDRVLTEYPYLLYRYGIRGKRFTDADGAWIATLTELGEDAMFRQLDWLRSVLSSRGIPSVIVARHMHLLAEELPDGACDRNRRDLLSRAAEREYHALNARVSRQLREHRRAILYRSLGHHGGDPRQDILCGETVQIIASAVTDRDRGEENALTSILDFFARRSRFGDAWVEAVLETAEVFQSSSSTDARDAAPE